MDGTGTAGHSTSLPFDPTAGRKRRDTRCTPKRVWRTRVRPGDDRTLVCTGRPAVTRAGDVSRCGGGRVGSRHHANNRGWPSESLQRFAGIHLPARSGGSSDRNRRPCIFGGRWSLCSLGANLGWLIRPKQCVASLNEHRAGNRRSLEFLRLACGQAGFRLGLRKIFQLLAPVERVDKVP